MVDIDIERAGIIMTLLLLWLYPEDADGRLEVLPLTRNTKHGTSLLMYVEAGAARAGKYGQT